MTNREEVAKRLRQEGESLRNSYCSGSTVFVTVKDTIGLNDVSNRKAFFDRLADLIDPACHDFGGEEGTNGENYDFACSACGWCGDVTKPNYCPNCGARVVRDEA